MQGKEHLLRKNPVAIVGMAGVFAGAKNIHEYWKNIIEGVDSITDIPASRWEIEEYFDPDPSAPDKTYCKRGGFIPDLEFDPVEYGLPPNILEDTDVSQLLALLIARDALENAGYGKESGKLDDALRANTGVVLGVGGGQKLITPLTSRLQYPIWRKVLKSSGVNDTDAEKIIEKMKLAYVGWKENSFPGMLGNVISGRICNRFDLGGLNCVVDAACAASLGAVKMAVSELVEGRADMMLTGGVDTDNSPFMYMCFSKTPAFSKSGNIRPLDAESDGMMIGEGVGMMVLKRLKDAERDGDHIYAVIKGVGSSSDGRYKSIYAPRKSGQVLAMNRAYEESGYKPGSVGLIEAHGTGTTAGDITEFNSVNEVFSEGHKGESHIAIGSVKSQIGHTKACAGAAGMIKIAMALDQKVLPGTINVDNPNPEFDLDNSALYVNAETRPWINLSKDPRRASVSAFGFGGINVHFALEEYLGKKSESKRYYSAAYPIFFEQDDLNALKKEIQEFAQATDGDNAILAMENQILQAEKKSGTPLKYRAGFVFTDIADAQKKIALLQTEIGKYTSGLVESPVGVFISDLPVKNNDQIVALFPGQGAQYVNMGNNLNYSLKDFSQPLEQMDMIRQKSKNDPLSSVIYPKPVFNNDSKNELNKTLTNTENAQPAIGAISAGIYKDLVNRGFKSTYHAGHSFGELTALWASGVLDDEGYYELAIARGEAMSAIGGGKDAGKMLAVKASEEKLAADIKDHGKVVMANINAPEQVVLGGPSEDIDKVAIDLESKGYKVSALNVSAAFHTPLVGHGVKKFAERIDKITFKKPAGKVYSNSSGNTYPQEPNKIKGILSDHILNSVRFKDEIEQIHKDGGRIFVEIGPKRILSNLVKDILGDKEYYAVSTQSSPSKNAYSQYLESLVKLRVLGCAISLEDNFRMEFPKKVETSKLAIKVGGNSYVSDKTKQAFQDALNDGHTITPLPEMVQSQPTNRLKEESERIIARARGVMDQSMRELLQLQEQIHGPTSGAPVSQPQVPATPQPAAQPAAQPTPVASGINGEEVNQKLKEVISDKTGYPVEMLENSMDMEADLGIDSIKRVEIFGAMQEAYPELASINPQALGELRTLGEIGTFLLEQAGGNSVQASAPAPQPAAQPAAQPTPVASGINGEEVNQKLKEVISDKTGYPVEMLENTMDMEADLGIDSIKRVEIFGAMQEAYPELASINPQALGELRTLGEIGTFLLEQAGGSSTQASAPTPQPAAQPSAQPTPVASGINGEEVNQKLKEVISDKTGYPVEMLENGMDMEADLGIDSIKRVEIFGAMQEAYPELASINPQALGELRTLGEIGTFLLEQAGGSSTQASAPVSLPVAQPTAQPTPVASGINGEVVNQKLKEVISDKTGYPVEMLENSMDMEADLGIDSIKRVEIFGAMQEAYPELASINPQALGELRTLGEIGTFLLEQAGGSSTQASAPTPQPATQTAAQSTPVASGVNGEEVNQKLKEVISDKTGYPVEMLENSMDMEADLGIDSIKRVEIFGAMQEAYPELASINPQALGELRTLGEIGTFLLEQAGGSAAPVSAPQPAAQPATQPTPIASGINGEEVNQKLKEVISDKTGYPVEMLENSMDMEADLGIDSIKRVEIFGAMQEAYPELASINPQALGELRTLGEIGTFLLEQAGGAISSVAQNGVETAVPETSKKKVASHQLELKNAQLVQIPPPDQLAFEHVGKVILAESHSSLGKTIGAELTKLGYEVHHLDLSGAKDAAFTLKSASKKEAKEVVEQIVSDTSLAGFIYLHPTTESSDKDLEMLQKAFLLSTQLGDKWSNQTRPFYLGISQIDGHCGMQNKSGNSVIGGGISGLVKSLNREWMQVFCRAIDIDSKMKDEVIAGNVLREITDSNQKITEVAHNKKGRFSWEEHQDVAKQGNSYPWENEVFLVTGGARGVTADCIKALAERKNGTFILLGRTQNDFQEPPQFANVTDEKEIKRMLMEEMKSKGEKPEIEKLERTYRKIIASREINETLSTLSSLGSRAMYYALDVTDEKACQQLIPEIEKEHGKITSFIHGAGQLSDKSIADKSEEDFKKVIHPKVLGLQSILGTLDKRSLKGLVCFSSVAGFYGNMGQTDYAIANEILNKQLFSEKLSNGNSLIKSMVWGAWDGGMVSAELKKMFENSGIVLIDRNEGANVFADLFSTDNSEDVLQIVGGELPGAGGSRESDEGKTYVIHRTIDLNSNAFFKDHAINGTAVIPYAAATSWFADAASALYPSYKLNKCFDSKLYKGLTFDKSETLDLSMVLKVESISTNEVVISGHIQSITAKGLPLKHYACNVSLVNEKRPSPTIDLSSVPHNSIMDGDKLYADGSLFHEHFYKGIKDIYQMDDKVITYKAHLPEAARDIQGQFPLHPVNSAILDVQFQGFLAWEKQMNEAGCLPQGFESVEVFDNPKNGDEYIVLIDILDSSSFKLVGKITLCDSSGKVYMKTTNLEGTVSKDLIFETSKKAISE